MLTKENERTLEKKLRVLREKAKTSWGAKIQLEQFWGEASDNDARDGANGGDAPQGY